jgi:hypothetical protein
MSKAGCNLTWEFITYVSIVYPKESSTLIVIYSGETMMENLRGKSTSEIMVGRTVGFTRLVQI